MSGEMFFSCAECSRGFTLRGSMHLRTVNICDTCAETPDPGFTTIQKMVRDLRGALATIVFAHDEKGRRFVDVLPEEEQRRVLQTLDRYHVRWDDRNALPPLNTPSVMNGEGNEDG